MNLAKIAGGKVYNKVPDACTLSIDIRFYNIKSVKCAHYNIKKFIKMPLVK
ncbi:peptidase dimerization domain-containing protein [Staphylococcus equorum]|nr:peptidase dimerization domain-containing protein [Staphylococcus equorum]